MISWVCTMLLSFTLLTVCVEVQEKKDGIAMRSEVRNVHQLWGTQLYEPIYTFNFDALLVPSTFVISDSW